MSVISTTVLFVLTLSSVTLEAQTTANGSIRGVVTDQQGAAVPGVLVSATSPTVPGTHLATSDGTGRYILGDLPPGDYTIVGELAGFARFLRTPVTVRAGLNLDVDIVMRVGAIDETVEVRVDTPLLETRNAGQAVNISGELLRAVPLLERREWFGALTVVPGVTSAEWVNNERLFSVHGADASANVVQIDGADVTPSFGSSIRYVNLSTDAIDDIQIKTAGVDASSPLGIGGIINIATTSGTNTVRGLATVLVQPREWNSSNTPGGTSNTIDQTQADLSLGAPVRRDRLWAFAAYRYADITSGASRTASQLDALRGLVPGFTPFDATNTAHFWFAKVTAQFSPAHQMTGFYQYDVNPALVVDPIGVNPSLEALGGSGASVRLSSIWSNRLTTRAGVSYNDKRRNVRDPEIDAPLERVFQSTIVSAGRPTGNGLLINRGSPITAWTTRPNSKLTLSFDATLLADRALGAHQLQAGIYAQPRIHIGQQNYFVNGGFTLEDVVLRQPGNYAAGVLPFHRVIMDGTELTSSRLEGHDYAFYVQDAWRPSSRLTVNAGIRVDRVGWTDRLFDLTSHSSTAIGPRLGVNYALTADSRRVIRGHWVRVHDQPSQMAPSVGSATLGQRDLYDSNFDGTFETVFVTPSTLTLTRGRFIDPDLHQPFVQEWGLGFTSQLPGRMSFGVDAVHREFRDRPALVETNGRYEDRVFRGYLDEEFNDVYEVTNNRWNWPVYASLELSFTKRTTRLQAIASYVRQWRHIGGSWQPNDPGSFIQPSAFANNRGIGNATGPTSQPVESNSLSGTQMTQRSSASAQWQDHAVRSGVAYTGQWNLLLAANYTFQSGAWSGPIIARAASPDPAFGPATVTLSNGRPVTNPLATVFRFAYPTRGEGQLKTPILHVWNVRVGRRFTWRRVAWDAALDVFNATNHDADLSFQSGANQTFNPLYGQTTFRQLPRSAHVTVRMSF
jgi:Carboxypeptidase regulatory-like domain/TonB dependent receptor